MQPIHCGPSPEYPADQLADGVIRLLPLHPYPVHRFRGQRTGGITDDAGQVDPVHDLLRDPDQVDQRHRSVEVDPTDDRIDVHPVDHRTDVDPGDHAVDVDPVHDPIEVDPLERRVQVDRGHHAVQVDALDHCLDVQLGGDGVQIDVLQDQFGQVEFGQCGVDDPGDHRAQQRLDQLFGGTTGVGTAALRLPVQPGAALAGIGDDGFRGPRGQPATEPDGPGRPPCGAEREVDRLTEQVGFALR